MKFLLYLIILGILVQCKDFLLVGDRTNSHENFKFLSNPPSEFIWPISHGIEVISDRITSVFGESRWDHFHNGLDIASYLEPVRAIANANLLYSRYASDDPFREEWGSGDTIWLNHGGGFYSSYFHLHQGRLPLPFEIQKGDIIGRTGNSGHSSGAHLHFILARDFGRVLVNPLKYLPAIEDSTPPTIANLFVHVGDRYTNINPGDTIQLSSTFPFTIGVLDSGVRKTQRWGVQTIQIKLNGKIIKESRFNEIVFNGETWMNDDGLNFHQLFLKDRYLVGELSLPSGEHTIEVIASDFYGNTAYRSFTFYVNRI